jgi:hypothetical protein
MAVLYAGNESGSIREVEAMPFMHVDDAAELIRLEYLENPGLRLTFWQAQRLWNLSEELCDRAPRMLVQSGFLARTDEGHYLRRDARSEAESIASLVRAMGG